MDSGKSPCFAFAIAGELIPSLRRAPLPSLSGPPLRFLISDSLGTLIELANVQTSLSRFLSSLSGRSLNSPDCDSVLIRFSPSLSSFCEDQ